MRVVFGIILALGGIWLMWLVLTGLPFPWEDPNPAGAKNTASNRSATLPALNIQAATVAPLGSGVLGVNGAQ